MTSSVFVLMLILFWCFWSILSLRRSVGADNGTQCLDRMLAQVILVFVAIPAFSSLVANTFQMFSVTFAIVYCILHFVHFCVELRTTTTTTTTTAVPATTATAK